MQPRISVQAMHADTHIFYHFIWSSKLSKEPLLLIKKKKTLFTLIFILILFYFDQKKKKQIYIYILIKLNQFIVS